MGGIVYTESARKVAYFVNLAERRALPIIYLQDVSGFMVGVEAEFGGIIRAGAEMVESMACATVPKIVLTLNHASGAGYYAMAGQGFDPTFTFSWPTARIGVMEGDSAVQALHGVELEKHSSASQPVPEELQQAIGKTRADYERWLDALYGAARGHCGRRYRSKAIASGFELRAGSRRVRQTSETSDSGDALESPTTMIRIANGQGFWGDWLEAPVRLVEDGPIDYLTLDYLAEVTMSVLQKQKQKDANLGYARDFPPLMARLSDQLHDRGVKVIANAGGVNPTACAREVRRLAPHLKVAVVLGDDVFGRIDELLAKGHELRNLDTGAPLEPIRDRVLSANAYLGAFPLAQALATGAEVVIAGRCADAALALAPMIHRFGWREDDWDRLAAGVVAGHIIECGAQCTGGNCQADWQSIPSLANIGYPIAEAESDGLCTITKHPGTGGRVSLATVKEQLVYEVGDPAALYHAGRGRRLHIDPVWRRSARIASGSAAHAACRARVCSRSRSTTPRVGRQQAFWSTVGRRRSKRRVARIGSSASGSAARPELRRHRNRILRRKRLPWTRRAAVADPPEVELRIGVRGQERRAVERFTRELVPLVLSGPPTATGYGEGRPQVREVVAYWPALIPRSEVKPRVEVVE